MPTTRISKRSWNYILKEMELNPNDKNIFETTEDNGNYLCVSVSVDWWYNLLGLEIEIWDKDGNQLEINDEQYILLRQELEHVLYEQGEYERREASAEVWKEEI